MFNVNSNDVDNIYDKFLNTYLQIFHSCFPKSKIYENSCTKHWITTGIKISCQMKGDLYLLTKVCDNIKLNLYYKLYCKILNEVIIEAKILNSNDKCTKAHSKVKTPWNVVGVETGKQGKNKVYIKPRMINPKAFNNHFLTIAENTNHNIPAQTTDNNRNYKYYLDLTLRSPFPKVRFISITTKDNEKVISLLYIQKNSCGYDEILMKILNSTPYISLPLYYIFNKAISVGPLPSCLKYSIITPIHKKGDKQNCANNRPISLLTSFCKVFEKVLHKRLI